MKKTSVYLSEEEASQLRRLAVREGRPQAELIREGIQRLVADLADQPREFKSLGKGRGGGQPYGGWESDRLFRAVMGRD